MKTLAIVLNGTSSAGKTSTARAIQRLAKSPVLYVALDTFTDMFDWASISDPEVRKDCHRIAIDNLHTCLTSLTASVVTVVVDHVWEQHAWFEACQQALHHCDTYWIGVHCPLEIVEQRERDRGDRRIGLSRLQFDRVHVSKPYHFEIDTSLHSPDECAEAILKFVEAQQIAEST